MTFWVIVFPNKSDFEQQIVMVSRSWESQIENAKPLCNQTVNLETDVKTLYYTIYWN